MSFDVGFNAIFGLSRRQKNLLIVPVPDSQPSLVYEWSKSGNERTKDDFKMQSYRCDECFSLYVKKKTTSYPLCEIHITGERQQLVTDPIKPNNSAHNCNGILASKSQATQILRELKKKIKQEGTQPLKAWEEALQAFHIKGLAEGWSDLQLKEVKATCSRKKDKLSMQRAQARINPKLQVTGSPLSLGEDSQAEDPFITVPRLQDSVLQQAQPMLSKLCSDDAAINEREKSDEAARKLVSGDSNDDSDELELVYFKMSDKKALLNADIFDPIADAMKSVGLSLHC